MELLKKADPRNEVDVPIADGSPDDDQALERIRCPLCRWRPTPSSSWCCHGGDTPEPPFAWCGTHWNTFLTRGRCPGCLHQWRWTSCLRCQGWSLHEDWYEAGPEGS